jgi:uncharacterized protein (TIRG00374 family)
VIARANSMWRDFRRWLPGVLISLIALYMVFRLASWQDIGQAFQSIKLVYLIPGTLLVLLWLALRGLGLRALLVNQTGFWPSFRAINIGYLLNNLFPLRAGEFGRAIILGKSSQLGTAHVLSAIVIERAFDLAFAACLLLSTLPLALGMDWAKPIAITTLLVILSGFVVLFLVARNQEMVQRWANRFGERYGWVKRYILPQVQSLMNGLGVLTQPKQFLVSLAFNGLSWLVGVGLYYVMLFSIRSAVPFWWGIFADSILAMGIALPSAPAALGVFEASLVAGLGLLDVPYSDALAYAILMHFLQFVITGILGFYSLTKERHSIGALFNEVRFRKSEKSVE